MRIDCPVCSRQSRRLVFKSNDFPIVPFAVSKKTKQYLLQKYTRRQLFVKFSVWTCRFCGHFFQGEQININLLDNIYKKFYNYPSLLLSKFVPGREKFFLDVFKDKLLPLCQKLNLKKILEIGCFDGYLLYQLKKQGFAVTGCDPSRGAIIARKFGLNVEKRYFSKNYFQKKYKNFDIIISRHLIEHLAAPLRFLEETKQLLSPGGLMIFETPSVEYFLKQKSFEDFDCQHLQNFTRCSIKMMLQKCGLKQLYLLTTPENFIAIATPNSGIRVSGRRRLYSINKYSRSIQKGFRRFQNYLRPFICNKQRIAIWGAGGFCGKLFSLYKIRSRDIAYIVDSDERKKTMQFLAHNLPICSPQKLQTDPVDLVIIASMYNEEILKKMRQMKLGAQIIDLRPSVRLIKKAQL